MAKRIKVGSKVLCRYYNTPEGKFYGHKWQGKVLEILGTGRAADKKYKVICSNFPPVVLQRKEIQRVLS